MPSCSPAGRSAQPALRRKSLLLDAGHGGSRNGSARRRAGDHPRADATKTATSRSTCASSARATAPSNWCGISSTRGASCCRASSVKTPSPNNGPNQRLEPVSASNRFNFDLLADYNPAPPENAGRRTEKAAAAGKAHGRIDPRAPQSSQIGATARPSSLHRHAQTARARRSPIEEARNEQRESRHPGASGWPRRSPGTTSGFAVLILLVVGLAVRFGLDWVGDRQPAPTTRSPASRWS